MFRVNNIWPLKNELCPTPKRAQFLEMLTSWSDFCIMIEYQRREPTDITWYMYENAFTVMSSLHPCSCFLMIGQYKSNIVRYWWTVDCTLIFYFIIQSFRVKFIPGEVSLNVIIGLKSRSIKMIVDFPIPVLTAVTSRSIKMHSLYEYDEFIIQAIHT